MWILDESPLTPNLSPSESDLRAPAQKYTHSASLVPRLSLVDFHLARAQLYATQGQPMKVFQSMLNALRSLGYDMDLPESSGRPIQIRKWGMITADLVLGWMALVSVYDVAVPDLAAQANEYAQLVYRIGAGENETFEEGYRECPF